MADLAITQIMQEQIIDNERGVINGVQHSLNQLLNMIKDILVILLPDPRTFGILIIISCFSVCSGFLSYLIFAGKSPDSDVAKRSPERQKTPKEEEKMLFTGQQTNDVGTNSEV
uniref:Solute carrier family 40 member n=1 Tax=Romanomermis culicivorax TaxID=13658 RepID=A0A915IY49_ROMCU